jgi:N-formylglutamate amidohydrolase
MGTEEIFGAIPGRVSLIAQWSRLVIDLNRAVGQRDRNGIVAHSDYHGRSIYREGCYPDNREVERRIREYYRPFHERLAESLQRPDINALFDCHSLAAVGPAEAPDRGRKRKDITLGNNGDQNGRKDPERGDITCPPKVLSEIREVFEKNGFSVALNQPYAGGFITRNYGQSYARKGKIVVQIEINQCLYMEPEGIRLISERVARVTMNMKQVFEDLAVLLSP